MGDSVLCPDCGLGRIPEHDRCPSCGLSWEDLEAAAAFVDDITDKRVGSGDEAA